MKTTKEFKSDNQKTLELIENGSVKEIKEKIQFIYEKTPYTVADTGTHSGNFVDEDSYGDTALELVKRCSNDFTKDIAIKCLENQYNLSEKQAWCIAYQIINNRKVYILEMKKYDEECKKDLAEIETLNQ